MRHACHRGTQRAEASARTPIHQHAVHLREGKAPSAPQFTNTRINPRGSDGASALPNTQNHARRHPPKRDGLLQRRVSENVLHLREGKAPPARHPSQGGEGSARTQTHHHAYQSARLGRSLDPPEHAPGARKSRSPFSQVPDPPTGKPRIRRITRIPRSYP